MDNEQREREERERQDALQRELMEIIMNNRAGIHSPACGKYTCGNEGCGHKWISMAAWRSTGQACKRCHNQTNLGYEIIAIHYFFCRPCNNLWRNTNTEPRVCSICSRVTESAGLRVPAGYVRPVMINPRQTNRPHKMNMCEKCVFLNAGRDRLEWVPCYETFYWRLVGELQAEEAAADV